MKNEQQLRVLHLEDNRDDAELIRRRLTNEGFSCTVILVKTKDEFEAALRGAGWDIILSDCAIPGYNGLEALRAAQEVRPEVPFLFVSGTIGEDKAVQTLKAGATDYILKDRLERLGAALRRALRESSERALRIQAELERKELEERLRQAQKMEAVGQLAGGVAHDFNNLLVVIRGYTEMFLMSGEHISAEAKDWFKQVLSASERASGLTRQLLTFSRKQPMEAQALDFNAVITEMVKMLRRVIEAGVRLECQYGKELPHVLGDQGMLEQVLLNLVVNARNAMSNGGELTIRTEKVAVSEEQAKKRLEARAGEFVCLRVEDTGTGIAREHLPRIFEPFFTTKKVGVGTGLGLATVFGIVKQHQGWVEVESEIGKGSVFRVYLPAYADAVGKAVGNGPQEAIRGGTERILLAEDDEQVRRMAGRMLKKLGYMVTEAATGRAALELWLGQEGNFDLLLTDILMPDGLTGRELADKLREVNPGLRVVFSSGYSNGAGGMDTEFFRRHKDHFLQKPYSSRTLAEAVRQCLDER